MVRAKIGVREADMKRAKQRQHMLKTRNPVARSPLLRKGGPHGKSTAAERRLANIELTKLKRDPELPET